MPEKWFEYAEIGGGILIWWWDSSAQQTFEKRLDVDEAKSFKALLQRQSDQLQAAMLNLSQNITDTREGG